MQQYALILAGGRGTRFWPFSTSHKPKQFLDVLGLGESLLQATYARISQILPAERIFVITHARYANWVSEQLPAVTLDRLICEPESKNTAASILLGLSKIRAEAGENAAVLVAPSDHFIENLADWVSAINKGLSFLKTHEGILTLGIPPLFPNTQYGYIQVSSPIEDGDIDAVVQFAEKPDVLTAKAFLEQGNFYWNSGLFFLTTDFGLSCFRSKQSAMYELLRRHESGGLTLDAMFEKFPTISFDYAIMEHVTAVYVLVASRLGWSDLGTWDAVYACSEKDNQQNVCKGGKVHLQQVQGSLVYNDTDRHIFLQGIEDAIVINQANVLMIVKRNHAHEVQRFSEIYQSYYENE